MTTFTVHLYREMRLVFRDIEAASHWEAASIASEMPTYEAEGIEDCEGDSYSAHVEREEPDDYEERPVRLRADGGEIEAAPGHVTNEHRAKWAEAALSVFMQHTGCGREDALGDLLCDLMHWARRNRFDFDRALMRAQGLFEDECTEEEVIAITACAPTLFEALLDIKRLASKHDDNDIEPYTLLELIEQKAIWALGQTKGEAQ